jgi:hypothetical protein
MATTLVIDPYVLDTLMRDLVGHDRRPASYLVYLAILLVATTADIRKIAEWGQ